MFVSRLTRYVGDRPTDELKKKLKLSNPWLSDVTAHKIKDYFLIFKLTTKDTTEIDKLMNDGLNAFNFRIAPSQNRPNYRFS